MPKSQPLRTTFLAYSYLFRLTTVMSSHPTITSSHPTIMSSHPTVMSSEAETS